MLRKRENELIGSKHLVIHTTDAAFERLLAVVKDKTMETEREFARTINPYGKQGTNHDILLARLEGFRELIREADLIRARMSTTTDEGLAACRCGSINPYLLCVGQDGLILQYQAECPRCDRRGPRAPMKSAIDLWNIDNQVKLADGEGY